MIDEKDLRDAIAECQGVRNPSPSTCIKLASYYTILDKIKDTTKENYTQNNYSYYTPNITEEVVRYDSNSEFFRIANGRKINEVWAVVDEIMNALQVLNPKLYKNAIIKLEGGI